jgi:nucleotide-binding universal stress UspA family protein
LYRRIVVPVQGGQLDTRAIDLATAVGNRSGVSELTLLYVVEVPQNLPLDADLPEQVAAGEAVLERASRYVRTLGEDRWSRVLTELLQARSAAAAIVDEAIERGADAVILAVTNRQEFGVVTQGVTLPYIMKNTPCDIVLVRSLSADGSRP